MWFEKGEAIPIEGFPWNKKEFDGLGCNLTMSSYTFLYASFEILWRIHRIHKRIEKTDRQFLWKGTAPN